MEAVLFIGIQGAGKSTFYIDRFFRTHVRINLDMLKTRHREGILFEACLAAKQRFVIDNTNPTAADRCRYMERAKAAGFRVVGYYFQSRLEDCLARNSTRPGKERIPEMGVLRTFKKLEIPSYDEGFDQLFYVQIADDGFTVEEWKDELQ